jgi:hypothetical protein
MSEKSRSESGMNIPDHISESIETNFWFKILQFFDAYADPGTGNIFDLDPGWKLFGSGINIPDPLHSFRYGTRNNLIRDLRNWF